MDGQTEQSEWLTREPLPDAFVRLINQAVREHKGNKVFIQIAAEWEVNPALVSRWMAGFGPLNQEHIQKLVMHLGPGVYTALGLFWRKHPDPGEG